VIRKGIKRWGKERGIKKAKRRGEVKKNIGSGGGAQTRKPMGGGGGGGKVNMVSGVKGGGRQVGADHSYKNAENDKQPKSGKGAMGKP